MVKYNNKIISSREALRFENIIPFDPKSKEGLALTNGTTFMASILCISLKKEIEMFNQIMKSTCLFMNSIKCVEAAFTECLNLVRG